MTRFAPASATATPAVARGAEPVDRAVDASPPPARLDFVAARERFFAQLAELPRSPAKTVWNMIDDLLETYDGDLHIEYASRCAWSGEIRLTLSEPEGAPSRSISFRSVGGAFPETVAERLLAGVRDWLATSDARPLPPPPWMVD